VRRRATALLLVVALLAVTLAGCEVRGTGPDGATGSPGSAAPSTRPTSRPAPGHELYGFLPYWEVDDGIADHLATVPLTTLALFSVTNTGTGAIDTTQPGYQRITGEVGRRIAREAQERGTRVELVFTSFGVPRNRRLFARPELQDAVIVALVGLAAELGFDGVNVDVEGLDPRDLPAFEGFVQQLRGAARAHDPGWQVSVATAAGGLGAAMAAAAHRAGADRIFLMGYDYRVAGSQPGASAPLDRVDGNPQTLRWSLDRFEDLGVPVERTILGLPLYGMTWPVAGPGLGAPRTGRGEARIPRRNLDLLSGAAGAAVRDDVEGVDVWFVASDGWVGLPPDDAPLPPDDAPDRTWTAVYVDAPDTLGRKLELANERGLAGGGFWAIGYERGLPAFTDLMRRFAAGGPVGGSQAGPAGRPRGRRRPGGVLCPSAEASTLTPSARPAPNPDSALTPPASQGQRGIRFPGTSSVRRPGGPGAREARGAAGREGRARR
jgi:hypothetical protein